jgi:pantoate--beta-alanine ligase
VRIIHSVSEMQSWASRVQGQRFSVGFVPTMGALHEGHLALVRRARRENDAVVVSIFVNPLQFGPKEDFKKYPRTLAKDLKLLQKEKTSVVFVPSASMMYPAGTSAKVSVPALDHALEGAARPGHFDGVATVVAKFFHIVQPTRAYFGQKDYQQVRVIDRMIKDLNMPVHLVACATVREVDGLAYSSRNRYLSNREREEAVKIYQALFLGRELVSEKIMKKPAQIVKRLHQIFARIPKCKVDYIALADPETLEPLKKIRRPALLAVAVRIGRTRLIDNIVIP